MADPAAEAGGLSTEQIERVAGRLGTATPEQRRVVVVHQPLAVTEPQGRPHLFKGCREAVRAWAAAGADLLMGGHIHRPDMLASTLQPDRGPSGP